jgi:hypothetical protein
MRKIKSKNYAMCFILGFTLLSCVSESEPPPFVIGKPVCIIAAKPGYYAFGGIEFEFLNISDKKISGMNISFMVYDADTRRNPFIGSNLIKLRFGGDIAPHESKKLIISLDNYMYAAPVKPYIIDFFYIAEINYADGSRWEDTAGVYYTNSY